MSRMRNSQIIGIVSYQAKGSKAITQSTLTEAIRQEEEVIGFSIIRTTIREEVITINDPDTNEQVIIEYIGENLKIIKSEFVYNEIGLIILTC